MVELTLKDLRLISKLSDLSMVQEGVVSRLSNLSMAIALLGVDKLIWKSFWYSYNLFVKF